MRQRSAGWKMFPEPTQSEQPVPTKNHYTRWYMWLIYLALGALLVAGGLRIGGEPDGRGQTGRQFCNQLLSSRP